MKLFYIIIYANSFINTHSRLLNPNYSILGQLPGTDIYVDKSAFIECKEVNHVKIFRFNSPLCYLNRTMFKSCIEKLLPSIYRRNTYKLCQESRYDAEKYPADKVKYLIIDCSALAYCDYSGAATLVEIIEELDESAICCYLAACSVKFINMLEKLQKMEHLEHNIFPTIGDAVSMIKYLESRLERVRPDPLSTPASVVVTSSDSI